ncbi:FkbM family methyltransferase [Desulfobulbus rhabdoformis]|uniref:FkbM family methyltransferase n=1 Tax=Desulfobulbus rhabdoformis TaxID=34032 RepID=UPI0019627D9B|nr:FkbM family methyltransferase [Desulfobulbus rhabdoformis]MBM9614408.1 FkbM family methyltransferase [Desulfobulbus rhabdoformis]
MNIAFRIKKLAIKIREPFLPETKWSRKSFSQEGEDLVLNRFFEGKGEKNGFYIDIGAHHPIRFSNTYLFYRNGWRGINVDATPGSMNIFKRLRPEDINLECAISDSRGKLPYYMFKEPALNTFSSELAEKYINRGQPLLTRQDLELQTLGNLLDENLKSNQKIDFMSVDVEGYDLQVLKANNWEKYRPTIILIESLDFDLNDPQKTDLYVFLVDKGYSLFAKTINTLFFKLSD